MLRKLSIGFGRLLFGKVIPRGLPIPIALGALRGKRYILGSAAGKGGGGSILIGTMEADQSKALSICLREGDVFFDVGANVGYYTLLGSRLVGPRGRVVAIEPLPRNISFLWRHIEINRLSNVRVVPAACGRSVALGRFEIGANCALGHLGEGDTIVPVVSLDSIADQTGLLPDVIKIDVEGGELEVLEGAISTLARRKPTIFLSLHSENMRRECFSFLSRCGYKISPIDTTSFNTATEIIADGSES